MFTDRKIKVWRQKVAREWSELDDEAKFSYTTPPISETVTTNKRKADMENDTPRKRAQRGPKSIDPSKASTGLTGLTSATRFVLPNTPSTTRSSSPKRDLVNELRRMKPEINCEGLKSDNMPDHVFDVVQKLTVDLGTKSIPIGVKDWLKKADRIGSLSIPPSAYDESPQTAVELQALWDLVSEIHTDGGICKNYGVDENAWSDKVVRPLLKAAVVVGEKTMMDVENIQSQGIHEALVPIFQVNTQFHKKADYAWAFSIKNKAVGRIYDRLSIRGHYTLSQMTDAFTKRCCLFSGVEVKTPQGSADNSVAQLGVWLSAGLRKTLNLYDGKVEVEEECGGETESGTVSTNEGKEPLRTMPLIGWTVIGHEWSTYIAWLEGNQDSATQVGGPIPLGLLRTDSYEGIFRILQLLRRVEEYAREVYWPWLERTVLEPLIADK